jgi:hypothetical protein
MRDCCATQKTGGIQYPINPLNPIWPTQITGTLTLENADDLFVTTDDFIVADQKFAAKHIAVWPCEQGTQSRYESLKKLANTGKQVTIRGFFRPITGRAGIGIAVPFAFCLTK